MGSGWKESHYLSASIDRFVVLLVSCLIALGSNTFPNSCCLKLIVIVIGANTEIEGVEGGAIRGLLSNWKNTFSILGWASLY